MSQVRQAEGYSHGYSSWKQVSGYFEGDGNVGLEVSKRTLRFKIRFVDTWKPQIESIAAFLSRRGIKCGAVGNSTSPGPWQTAYRLDIVGVESVARAAKAMM
ncbi:MAG TPA: LAGLIDADG family homing endonuclease, partial [Nitrososphaerales archaeon]|nr:LAGLIDADG family homing endonuclease [Nitrososphaerales archaeon]